MFQLDEHRRQLSFLLDPLSIRINSSACMACPTIDFDRADTATQSIPIQTTNEYQSRTLPKSPMRALFLPVFPQPNGWPVTSFLLANVPGELDFVS